MLDLHRKESTIKDRNVLDTISSILVLDYLRNLTIEPGLEIGKDQQHNVGVVTNYIPLVTSVLNA